MGSDRTPGAALTGADERPTVVIAGGGASGSLTLLHLLRVAGRRGTSLDVVLLDPADRWGRGVAFGTPQERHLLNVPVSGMSALPEDPANFGTWLSAQQGGGEVAAYSFVPRREFARYVDDLLTREIHAQEHLVSVRHDRTTAVGVTRSGSGWAVRTNDGRQIGADAVVVATGLPQTGTGWVPEALHASAFFVPDPWAPGALELVARHRTQPTDVLLVGAGLTMVDVVLSLTAQGDDRHLVAISRSGRLPRTHSSEPKLPVTPDISDWGSDLDDVVAHARQHLADVRATTGDWRPAIDGLRFRVAELWERLGADDRDRFLSEYAGEWNVHRHRMPPASADALDKLSAGGQLELVAAEVTDVSPLPAGGLAVTLSDGTRREVGWVVNCTGPGTDIRTLGNPLLDDLLRPRPGGAIATVAHGGMGVRTVDGRLLDAAGFLQAPVWTLGALRRGELWESTAVPEIRVQALGVATSVLDAIAPPPRRLEDGRWVGGHHPVARPRDPLGLPLSTTAEAAAAYNAGLERLMRLQSGAEELITEAADLDPDFAVAYATLGMLGHEGGVEVDVPACLLAAQAAVERRGDEREKSWVEVVTQRISDARHAGAQTLMAHIAKHPRDIMAVSAAVPTIAFSGVTDVQQEAWDLVEGLAPAYRDHWWYISLLAFTRQDQGRFREAGLLAESALACEPSSGHAVHAQAHVMYETGQHEPGRVWLDHWVAQSGRSASHRAHFSWHAALHELALGDTEAVRQRYYSQLAAPHVTGVRALVDSASLLWRWQLSTASWDEAAAAVAAEPAFPGEAPAPPVSALLEWIDPAFLDAPETPFVALHAAVALTAGEDKQRLHALTDYCASAADASLATVVAPVCEAFHAMLEQDWQRASGSLLEVMPSLVQVGGSSAQREIVEEALLYSLVHAGDATTAAAILEERLDRRSSPVDARRLTGLQRGDTSGR